MLHDWWFNLKVPGHIENLCFTARIALFDCRIQYSVLSIVGSRRLSQVANYREGTIIKYVLAFLFLTLFTEWLYTSTCLKSILQVCFLPILVFVHQACCTVQMGLKNSAGQLLWESDTLSRWEKVSKYYLLSLHHHERSYHNCVVESSEKAYDRENAEPDYISSYVHQSADHQV